MIEKLLSQFASYVRMRTNAGEYISYEELSDIYRDMSRYHGEYISHEELSDIYRDMSRYHGGSGIRREMEDILHFYGASRSSGYYDNSASMGSDRYYDTYKKRYKHRSSYGEDYGGGMRHGDHYADHYEDNYGRRYHAPKKDPYANESKLDRCVRKASSGLMTIVNQIKDDKTFLMEFLKDDRVNLASGDNSVVKWAVENGEVEIAQYLLSESTVTDALNTNELFKIACRNESVELVRILVVDLGVDVSYNNNIRARNLIRKGNFEMFEIVLNSPKYDPTLRFADLVYNSVITSDTRYFDKSLSLKGYNINSDDYDYYDLISIAMDYNNSHAVTKMLRIPKIVSLMNDDTKIDLIKKNFIPIYKSRKICKV